MKSTRDSESPLLSGSLSCSNSTSHSSDKDSDVFEVVLARLHLLFKGKQPAVNGHLSAPSTASTETEIYCFAARNTLHQSLDLFDYQDGVTYRHYALFATPGKLHRSRSESSLLITEEKEKSPRRWQY